MRAPHGSCPVHAGRERETAAIRGIAGSLDPGRRAAVVTGEAGVGKSRLVAEAVDAARAAGHLVLAGHCPRVATASYAPMSAALRRHTRLLTEAELARLFEGSAWPTLVLVPEVATILGSLAPAVVDPDDLDAALWQLFARLTGQRPVLLVLEDLQWAGPDMLRLFAGLVRETDDLPLSVVATCRSERMGRSRPLAGMLNELTRERRIEEIALEPLGVDDVSAMVTAMLEVDAAGRVLAEAIHRRTGGNPFFVEEICRALVERDLVDSVVDDPTSLTAVELPDTVRDTLLDRVKTLDPALVEILRTAAVAGSRVEPAVVAAAAGVQPHDVDRAIMAGLERRLLAERREGELRWYGFRHALVREALLSELVGPDRAAAHQRVAEATEATAVDLDRVASRLADLFAEAGDVGRARAMAHRAARWAAASGAPHEAALRFEQSIRLTAGSDAALLSLLVEAAEAMANPEYVDRARALAETALERACATDDAVARSRALSVLAWERRWNGDGDGALRLYRQAATAVEGRGDVQELRALLSLLHRHALRDEVDDAAPLLARADRLAERLGDARERARLASIRAYLGGGAELEVVFAAAQARAAATGDRALEAKALVNSGWSFLAMGEFDRARRLLAQAAEVGREASPRMASWAGIFAAGIDAFAGELDAAVQGLRRWTPAAPDAASRMMAADIEAETLLRRGRFEAAREHAEEGWRLARDTHESLRMVSSLALLGRARSAQGDGDVRVLFAEALRRARSGSAGYIHFMFTPDYARVLASAGASTDLERLVADVREMTARTPGHRPNLAALHVCEGVLAAVAGDRDSARDSLVRAADLYGEIPMAAREAEARLEVAEVEVGAGRDEAAAEHARRALDVARRIGSPPLEARAAAVLRRAGARVVTHRADRAGEPDPRLSARETEVAILVGLGLGNLEIATRLFLSERTVRNHVSNILAKLDMRRRAEVARWAVERGLVEG